MKFYSCDECDNLFYSYQENLDVKCCDKGLIELDKARPDNPLEFLGNFLLEHAND